MILNSVKKLIGVIFDLINSKTRIIYFNFEQNIIKMNKILTGLLLFSSSFLFGQPESTPAQIQQESFLKVITDGKIDDVIQIYKSSYSLTGYRIQIFSDNKKQPARDEKARFLSSFNHVKAHEVYQQPFFKIRVGDFRTKLEAYKFQKEIMAQFPNSFIVKDEIEIDQLIGQ